MVNLTFFSYMSYISIEHLLGVYQSKIECISIIPIILLHLPDCKHFISKQQCILEYKRQKLKVYNYV